MEIIMKKKYFAILLCAIVIMTLCVFPLYVGAEELPESAANVEPAVEEQTPVLQTKVSPSFPKASEKESTYNTLFTRVREFLCKYPEETVSIIGSFVILIFSLIQKHASSKAAKDTKESLKIIKGEVKETLGGQNSVVNVTNKMIDGYNSLSRNYDSMKEAYDQYGAAEGERNRVVGAVLATNSAILEILTTVYANSKNLPQGVKDIVNLKYANCLKTLEDDKQLIAIVEAVRNNIGTDASSVDNDTKVENTEA